MKIRVDADGTPSLSKVTELAQKYKIPLVLYYDRSHHLENEYAEMIECDKGYQSVDMRLIADAKKDIVITQDYGLATLALAKACLVVHPNGIVYDENNIDSLLHIRHIQSKKRKYSHIKGPKKRTIETEEYFLKQLENLIKTFTR